MFVCLSVCLSVCPTFLCFPLSVCVALLCCCTLTSASSVRTRSSVCFPLAETAADSEKHNEKRNGVERTEHVLEPEGR